MKRVKRIVSILLAAVLVLGMSVTAFAADTLTHTITVQQNSDDKTKHTYEAYQIFKGDLVETDGNKVLSNIEWGSGVDGSKLLEALKGETAFNDEENNNAFKDCETAAQVAKVLSDRELFQSSSVDNTTLTDTFAKLVEANLSTTVAGSATTKTNEDGEIVETGNVEIEVTGSGYYLVKDKDKSVAGDGAYTRFMLQVVGDATAVVKSEVPTGDKKVFYYGKDAYENGGEYDPTDNKNLAESNNAGLGDHVSFQITSKVPNYTGYDYYYFIMNDTMAEGLTFDGAGTVSVTIGNATLTGGVVGAEGPAPANADYYVYPVEGNEEHAFRIAFTDIMKYEIGAQITVRYSATINENAIIGSSGNENSWSLDYSKDPNEEYEGTKDENKPGLPLNEENTVLGQTPEEKTLTYLTQLDIMKYANEAVEKNLLPGAEFTLTGTSHQVVLNTVEYFSKADNGTFWKLLDGTYTEKAPILDTYRENGRGDENTTEGYLYDESRGVYYVPQNVKDYNGKTLYTRVEGTESLYADTTVKYVKTTATETTLVPTDVSIKLTTGRDGKISFKGLGEGIYTLTETVTPAGYNTIDPIQIVITFDGPDSVNDGTETCTWTMTWNGVAVDSSNGVFSQNVINNGGSLLPSTGGIGTTIFYVVGGILVLAAVVLLVTKKRMSAEK